MDHYAAGSSDKNLNQSKQPIDLYQKSDQQSLSLHELTNASYLRAIGAGTIAVGAGEMARLYSAKEMVNLIASNKAQANPLIPSKLASRLAREAEEIKELSYKMVDAFETKRLSMLHLENANDELKAVVTVHEEKAFAGEASAMSAKQLRFLKNGAEINELGFGKIHSSELIGSIDDAAMARKIFVQGTREANMIRGLERARRDYVLARERVTDLDETLRSRVASNNAITEVVSKTSYRDKLTHGISSGFAISAASIGTGYLADKMLGSNDASQSLPRLALDGVATPAVLASELPARLRIPLAAASFIGARALGVIENHYFKKK